MNVWWCMYDRETREIAGGWRQWEWMLWQGTAVRTAGKGSDEQGDGAAEIDTFMKCSSTHAEERWERQQQSGQGRNGHCGEAQWCTCGREVRGAIG
jgi:hypothetical protein